jgi:hypothetical protein
MALRILSRCTPEEAVKKKGKDVKWIRKSSTSLLILMLFTMGILVAHTTITNAQQPTQTAAKTAAIPSLLDPADTVILLLDHQSGLFQTVKDISVAELRTNTAILAKVGESSRHHNRIRTERPEWPPNA